MQVAKIAVAAVLAWLAGPANANPFNRLWVFGDSTVDTGWYKVSPYSGESTFDAYLPNAATYNIGKPTNNPAQISVQTLAAVLGLTANPKNQGGTNYATSGARNNESNTAASGFFPHAVPTLKQMQNYLNAQTAQALDLYVVSSGGNDVAYAVKEVKNGQMTNADGQAYVKKAANQLGAKIAVLQTDGAAHIIVANQPKDFGPSTDNTKLYRQIYNTTLQNKLNNSAVAYAWGDVNGVRTKIVDDPADFHITNVSNTTPVCTAPAADTGIKSSWALVCSSSSPVSTPTAQNPASTLFADNEHWASRAQRILGSYYFCVARHKWPARFNGFTAQPPFACDLFGL